MNSNISYRNRNPSKISNINSSTLLLSSLSKTLLSRRVPFAKYEDFKRNIQKEKTEKFKNEKNTLLMPAAQLCFPKGTLYLADATFMPTQVSTTLLIKKGNVKSSKNNECEFLNIPVLDATKKQQTKPMVKKYGKRNDLTVPETSNWNVDMQNNEQKQNKNQQTRLQHFRSPQIKLPQIPSQQFKIQQNKVKLMNKSPKEDTQNHSQRYIPFQQLEEYSNNKKPLLDLNIGDGPVFSSVLKPSVCPCACMFKNITELTPLHTNTIKSKELINSESTASGKNTDTTIKPNTPSNKEIPVQEKLLDSSSDQEKIIQDSCFDFMAEVYDTVLETVQKSVQTTLNDCLMSTVTKIDDLCSQMKRNELLLKKLCLCINEKKHVFQKMVNENNEKSEQ